MDAVAGRVPVIVGANAGSTRDVVAFCRQAEARRRGRHAGRAYYSLPRPDELFEHFRAVNEVIDIPIMLYNYPGRTGVDMTPDFIEAMRIAAGLLRRRKAPGRSPASAP